VGRKLGSGGWLQIAENVWPGEPRGAIAAKLGGEQPLMDDTPEAVNNPCAEEVHPHGGIDFERVKASAFGKGIL
jgi:hypothetical protein